jgi:uncharacterized protein YdiU (UPF0061 family)
MSVLGLTIDYGPFGFLDGYRPDHICNHSDHTGRYAFDRQPAIAMWNLGRFAQTLVPLTDVQGLQDQVDDFPRQFTEKYYELMCGKLGLAGTESEDVELVDELLLLMAEGQTDYTRTWRALAELDTGPVIRPGRLREGFGDPERFDRWLSDYATRLGQQGLARELHRSRMRAVNPKYVLRNHLAQTAIDRAVDHRDFSEIERLCRLLRRPFDDQPAMEAYAASAPAWARELTVSCSS